MENLTHPRGSFLILWKISPQDILLGVFWVGLKNPNQPETIE
jgi:hypothetical protein